MKLAGKNIIITGGGGILGEQFCLAMAEHGANIAIFDLNEEQANSVIEKCKEVRSEGTYKFYDVDVSDKESVNNNVDKARKDLGAISVLHNNAASKSSSLDKFFTPFEDFELSTWNEVMQVNVNGMFLMAQAVGKKMIEDGVNGKIIQTSSIYGHRAPDQSIYEGSLYNGREINTPAVYSVSKAAVHGLTIYLSSYWAKSGITINTLTPGGVFSGQNKTFESKYSARVPMGRMGQSDELASAFIFLASDDSRYITGQNLIVDGGLHIW